VIRALAIEDILKLMATEIDNDDVYFRIDGWPVKSGDEKADDEMPSRPIYIGPFSLYEP